ncbi:MAG: hypothetical protein QXO01_07010 [Nitrososphaerota archaeon]
MEEMSAKNPRLNNRTAGRRGRPSKLSRLLYFLDANKGVARQVEIRNELRGFLKLRTIENHLKTYAYDGVSVSKLRVIGRIPLINRLRIRFLFTEKMGDETFVYTPAVFYGREQTGILLWISIILLYCFTGYIAAEPRLVLYAFYFYLMLSIGVFVRILAWYLFARSHGLYRENWRFKIRMKGKEYRIRVSDGSTPIYSVVEKALKKLSPKNKLPPEQFELLHNRNPIDGNLQLYETDLKSNASLRLRRTMRNQNSNKTRADN